MTVAALALLGAAAWGTGDFLGGVAARRVHVLTVLVLSQAIGLAGATVWLVVSGGGSRRVRRGRSRGALPRHGRGRDGDRRADLGREPGRAPRCRSRSRRLALDGTVARDRGGIRRHRVARAGTGRAG